MARPRKTGQRYANGRLKPERPEYAAMYWQRERDALRLVSRGHELGSAVGLLFREGKLTDKDMAAAVKFHEQRMRADMALGLPPRTARAQDVNRTPGLSGAPDDEEAARKAANARTAYDAAEEAIGLGSDALAAVQWTVIYDNRPDDYGQLLALRYGLGRLAVHYGLVRA